MDKIKRRFEQTSSCHQSVSWDWVEAKLNANSKLLETVKKMEELDGEVIVLEYEGEVYFVDGYKETPKSRSNVCYDLQARLSRKKFAPESSAQEMVDELGSVLLSVQLYHVLQEKMDVDCKTSCWLETPQHIRKLKGALFGDKRYDTTFIYHNGADSYYGVRGFRSCIKIGSINEQ